MIHLDDREGPLSDPEERQVIFATLDSFRQYRKNCHYNVTHRRRQNFYALPSKHRALLSAQPISILDTFNSVDDAIDRNADIADAILELGLQNFGLLDRDDTTLSTLWHNAAKPNDMAKAHSTVRQFYRDWSAEGFESEVKPILEMVFSDLRSSIPLPNESNKPNVLLPGAGLGRLLFELALKGYAVEGNEISYHQLVASNFILNATQRPEQFSLYPFANTFTNHQSRCAQLKEVRIPDVHPGTAVAERIQESTETGSFMGEMNMTAGDFLTSYSDVESQNKFDAVLTVYFIDTAPNLIRYIETIRHCLKEGGVWVNVGPLLWHFDDRGTESADDKVPSPERPTNLGVEDAGIGERGSFELSDGEVLFLVKSLGFEVIEHEYLPEALGGYIQDPDSMIQNRYRCSHWVARKT